MVLRQQGASVSGSLQTQVGNSDFSNGTINGDAFHATTTATIQGQAVELTIDATISGNEMHGTINSEYGTATLTGTRTP